MSQIKSLFRGFPKATSFWSLFLILGAVLSNALVFTKETGSISYRETDRWSFGGPVENVKASGDTLPDILINSGAAAVSNSDALIDSYGSLIGNSEPLSNVRPGRGGLKKYKIKKGDTISSVAVEFSLTIETIRAANPSLKSRALRVGDELTILPVPGILYELKDGDSLETVSSRFRVDVALIKQYNPDYQKLFEMPGRIIILPFAKALPNVDYVNRYVGGLVDLKNYFILPTRGWNWGELHEYNAVDIADQCGRPIYASAEGLVINDEKFGDGTSGWNNGYGLFVLIEHPNGTRTRYAHNGKNLVKPGDYVAQSQEIALIGNTGNTHGPSGCHLHFEVYGARNPFAIR